MERHRDRPERRRTAWWPGALPLLFAAATLAPAASYNVDLEAPVVLRPPTQSGIHFGFSLAHFMNGTDRRLLVGAPLANTSQDVANPGALYTCDPSQPSSCEQMAVDLRNSDDKYQSWMSKDEKDNQRLGLTLAANERNIVVCAPRWHAIENKYGKNFDLALGMCFSAKGPNFNQFEAFSPGYDYMDFLKISYLNNGSCQVGFSAAFGKGADSINFGAPGCWNWQGDLWNMDLEDRGAHSRAFELSLNDLGLLESEYGTYSTTTELYLGYSVVSMVYRNVPAIVSAMPRVVSTKDLKVVNKDSVVGPLLMIFEHSDGDSNVLELMQTLKPPSDEPVYNRTMFSYFGYDLAIADVNGDSYDDIIVGAPFYYNNSYSDLGAIFVYMQKAGSMILEEGSPLRVGAEPFGRFGSCVSNIGDIDNDGYPDIAVAAPFIPGGGKVFVYMGSDIGLESSYRQVITASEMPGSNLPVSGFGHSVAEKMADASGQGFDIGIGAYESDTVFVFRTKEIVKVHWTMNFIKRINLTEKNCDFAGVPHACVDMDICLNFTIQNPKGSVGANLGFIVKLTTDSRSFFSNESEYNVTIPALQEEFRCIRKILYAKNVINDIISSFQVRGEIALQEPSSRRVILDRSLDRVKTEPLHILVNCSKGDISHCESDLTLSHDSVSDYSMDDRNTICIDFTAENKGENAYNTYLNLETGGYLDYKDSTEGINCDTNTTKFTFNCKINTIFAAGAKKEFQVCLATSTTFSTHVETFQNYFSINASLTTSSLVANPAATKMEIKVRIRASGKLDLTKDGMGHESICYNSSSVYKSPANAEFETELGEEVVQKFSLFNSNEYSIYLSKLTIWWPLKVEDKYLMYLLGVTLENAASSDCKYSEQVDEFELNGKVEEKPVEEAAREHTYNEASQLALKGDSSKKGYMEIECLFGELTKQSTIYITLRSRVVYTTIGMPSFSVRSINTTAAVEVMKLPASAPLPPKSEESVINIVITCLQLKQKEVPWWVYLIAILVGLMLLILIVILLWRCGFFKRKQIETAEDDPDAKENAEEDATTPRTPVSPMLRDTEKADADFDAYRKSAPGEEAFGAAPMP